MDRKTAKVKNMMHKVDAKEGIGVDKRVFGWVEVAFDALYLCVALGFSVYILSGASRQAQVLTGVMALVLAGGDAFHLVPRIIAAQTGAEKRLSRALGFGKFITSITMTVFYVLLWHIGILLFTPQVSPVWTAVVYILATMRVALCFFPQNRWFDEETPVNWAVYRNIPFLLLGGAVAVLFFAHGREVPGLSWMWLAIALSFAFYIPVVLWSGRNRKLGMLMLPKTCVYLWILFMCAGALC
jgi:hypothetical protein